MNLLRFYHNPRCSKSRQALSLLIDRGVEFEEYRYLERGVHMDDFEILANLPDVIRKSDVFEKEKYDFEDVESIKELIRLQPKCVQRPILVSGGEAVIGRPPENILILLL